ncbi:hypothetical protein CBE74_13070 [Corynebacterium silvaticum]|uniref:Uncharacterized protein n=1 Tax=Corynebacterium silvaticum TaxID=2320431 RepID=A0ACD4PZT7_9CORY|nr:hypothetical protein [Corynebacterium silvaticum]WCV10648.1 hypothetical protein CBE74_13070 [Corynebacterium silvaticum]
MVLQRMGSVKAASATLVAALAVVFALTLMKRTYSFGGFWSTEAHRNRSIDLQLFDAWSNPTLWYAPWLDAVETWRFLSPLVSSWSPSLLSAGGYP